MPPAAPLPTTMASQRALPGLIAAASCRDSASTLSSSSVSVRSVCMTSRPMFLTAMRAIFPVLGLTSDELAEELVALVSQLLVDADLGCVVPANRRLFRHHEELFDRRARLPFVAADLLQHRVDLRGTELGESRPEATCRFGV